MKYIRLLLSIVKRTARKLTRGSGKVSTQADHSLHKARQKTILSAGQVLSFEQEKDLVSSKKTRPGFMGIVDIKCKLGEYRFLTLTDDHIAERLFWFGGFGYERSSAVVFTHMARKANSVLDLGSYTGYFSILSYALAKNRNTYAVEANPLNYHRLCENLRINGANVSACHFALVPSGGSNDTIQIYYDAKLQVLDTGTYASHNEADLIPQKLAKRDSFTVPAISFTGFMEKFELEAPHAIGSYDLIKLDVEGLESSLLRDIIEFYSGSAVVILVEILTKKTYDAIYSMVEAQENFSLAYIREHDQTIDVHERSRYARQLGSRNFLIGSTSLIREVANISPHKLLQEYE